MPSKEEQASHYRYNSEIQSCSIVKTPGSHDFIKFRDSEAAVTSSGIRHTPMTM